MVVLIGLDTSLGVFDVEIKLSQLLKDVFVDWDTVIAHYYATVERYVRHLLAPFMLKDLLDSESFTRVYV